MTVDFIAIVSQTAVSIVQNATPTNLTIAVGVPLAIAFALRWKRSRKQN